MTGLGTRLLLVFLCFIGSAFGAEQVYLAVPLSMQPYFIAESGTGLTYETVEAAFAVQGRKIFPVFISERDSKGVLSRYEHIDCAGFQTERDSEDWFATDDIFPFHVHAVTLAGNKIELNSITDLKDTTVVGYLGTSEELGTEFRAVAQENPRYREIYNHRAQVKLLLHNRVQVIIADRLLVDWYVRYLARELDRSVELTFHDLFPASQMKFACRRSDLIQDFMQGLEEIKRNGKLEEIKSRYVNL